MNKLFSHLSFYVIAGLLLVSCKGPSPEDRILSIAESAELGTVEYTVKKIIKANDLGEWYKVGDRKILFSVTAFLKAGIDLGSFTKDNISIDEVTNTITLSLPHAKLLSFDMPAEQEKIEYQKYGTFRNEFSTAERTELLKQGEKDIRDDEALIKDLIASAERNAEDFFKAMLTNLGYSNIVVKFN